jgi:hypothetical protein
MDTDDGPEDASGTLPITSPDARHRWFSLWNLLLTVGVIAIVLVVWQVNRAGREALVVQQLEGFGMTFEKRQPEWFWQLCGEGMTATVVSVSIGTENAGVVIPRLESLPSLRQVETSDGLEDIKTFIPGLKSLSTLVQLKVSWVACSTIMLEDCEAQKRELEAICRREMPGVKVIVSVRYQQADK